MQQLPHPFIILDVNLSPFADSIFVGEWPLPRGLISSNTLRLIFFGVTLLQAWNYALNNSDGWIMRALVFSLVGLDIATTANNALLVHGYLIQHFGDLLELTTVSVGFTVELALTTVAVFLVQLFFASRVYLLNRRGYGVVCAIVATACLGFVSNCVLVSKEIEHREVADLTILPLKVCFILGQSLTTIADGITTLVLSVNFLRARSESSIRNTVSLLERLLAAVVARGVLVTVSNIILVFLYIFYPMNLYWLAVQFMQSKLYIITMIAMLNARKTYNQPASVIMSAEEMSNSFPSQFHGSKEISKKHHRDHHIVFQG
ncbi:hypothetical protein CPC08DRAFT_752698 [Agrocybe pediades]|nr:hypothetical protein CPC08DRAFT_752698 [Agrocybe pediades]